MESYMSGGAAVRMEQHLPGGNGKSATLLVLHGSGGAATHWLQRFAPALTGFGLAAFAPHYFDRTATHRATPEMILDGRHFLWWLEAIKDGLAQVAAHPRVDAKCIGVLGVSLGGYLAIALAIEDAAVRAVVEVSGGVPMGWEPRISSAMPPVLLVHGAADTVVPVSEAYKLRDLLAQSNVPHQAEIFPGETHWFSSAAQPRLLLATAAFLKEHLL